jgi:hypothetical protein
MVRSVPLLSPGYGFKLTLKIEQVVFCYVLQWAFYIEAGRVARELVPDVL